MYTLWYFKIQIFFRHYTSCNKSVNHSFSQQNLCFLQMQPLMTSASIFSTVIAVSFYFESQRRKHSSRCRARLHARLWPRVWCALLSTPVRLTVSVSETVRVRAQPPTRSFGTGSARTHRQNPPPEWWQKDRHPPHSTPTCLSPPSCDFCPFSSTNARIVSLLLSLSLLSWSEELLCTDQTGVCKIIWGFD